MLTYEELMERIDECYVKFVGGYLFAYNMSKTVNAYFQHEDGRWENIHCFMFSGQPDMLEVRIGMDEACEYIPSIQQIREDFHG